MIPATTAITLAVSRTKATRPATSSITIAEPLCRFVGDPVTTIDHRRATGVRSHGATGRGVEGAVGHVGVAEGEPAHGDGMSSSGGRCGIVPDALDPPHHVRDLVTEEPDLLDLVTLLDRGRGARRNHEEVGEAAVGDRGGIHRPPFTRDRETSVRARYLRGATKHVAPACAEYVVEIRSGGPGAGPRELKTLIPVRSDKCYRPAFGLALTGGLSTETWAWCRILFDRMHGRDSYDRCYADIGNMREYRYTNRDDGWDRLYSQFRGAARDIHWYTCLLGLWYSELKDAVDGAWRRMSATDAQRRLIEMDLWEYVVFCYADCIIQSLLSEDGHLTGHQLLSCFLIKMIDDTLDAEDDVASGELSNGYRTREGSAHATSLRDMTVMYMEVVSQEHRSMADIVGLITGWWYVACKQHGTGAWASDDGASTGGMEFNDVVVADIIEGSTAGLAWWTERTLRVWRDVDCRAWAPWYAPAGPDVAY